ncbi:MAG: inner membrane protein YpjD [Sandaracinaceae bacterium]
MQGTGSRELPRTMMLIPLFALTGLAYAVASGLYVAFLTRGSERAAAWAARTLVLAVLAHLGFLAAHVAFLADRYTNGRPPPVDIHQALALISLVMILVYLVTARLRPRLRVLGAFLTPVTLLFFLGAAFRGSVGPVPEPVRSVMLPIHVGVNSFGLAAFGLAFAAAIAYLIQERQLRRKELGGMFQRLPSLNVLDALGLRAVLTGFPLLTLGIVTGTLWAVRLSPSAPVISPTQAFACLAWVLFGAVLLLRVAAGWRGRKAAIGTMLGFLCTIAVLVGYVARGGGHG